MSIAASIGKLSYLTRSSDWRFSFVPFIMGCVYLWAGFLGIGFDVSGIILITLSLTTTIGFAALGYFINEHFDKTNDAAAGKVNKLALLKGYQQLFLLLAIVAITLLPWLWLPADKLSYVLIGTEIGLFLAYSLPYIRFKEKAYLAGIVDSSYAYVVPLFLAFHTYSLYTGTHYRLMVILFSLAVFFIGFRNIIIHQVNDVIGDEKAGVETLPMKIGVENTTQLLKVNLVYEVFFCSLAFVVIGLIKPVYLIWAVIYLAYITQRVSVNRKEMTNPFFTLLPVRHLTDQAYQVLFPLTMLFLLIIIDWHWLVLLPLHVLFLLPNSILEESLKYLHLFSIRLKGVVSILVNYPIYFFFLIFGVNLKKENKSAMEYLKSKFGK